MSVTAIVPTWNRPELLERALRSIREQTAPVNILVVDDGSDEPVRITGTEVVRKPHSGLAHTLNVGIGHATDEHIMFVSDDDYLFPRAVEKLSGAIGSADIAFADYIATDEAGGIYLVPTSLCDHSIRIGPCALYRKDVFDRIPAFDASVDFACDFDLYTRMRQAGMNFVHVDDALMLYSRSSDSITGRNTREQTRQADEIRRRYGLPGVPR